MDETHDEQTCSAHHDQLPFLVLNSFSIERKDLQYETKTIENNCLKIRTVYRGADVGIGYYHDWNACGAHDL